MSNSIKQVILFTLVAVLAACGPNSHAEVVHAIASADSTGPSHITLDAVYGNYVGCAARSGQWSLPLEVSSVVPATLSVELNDPSCSLTITYLYDGSNYYAGNISLGASFLSSPVSFGAFDANAELSESTFSNDFTVTIVYSSNPTTVTDTVNINNVVVSSTSSSTAVLAPDYTVDTSSISEQAIDGGVIQLIGNAVFTDGSTPAQLYVVTQLSVGTFAQDDYAFNTGTSASFAGTLPASALIGGGLPWTSTVILQNVVSGVPAYQTFTFTFNEVTVDASYTPVSCDHTMDVSNVYQTGTAWTGGPWTYTINNGQVCATVGGITNCTTCSYNSNDANPLDYQCPVSSGGYVFTYSANGLALIITGTGGPFQPLCN